MTMYRSSFFCRSFVRFSSQRGLAPGEQRLTVVRRYAGSSGNHASNGTLRLALKGAAVGALLGTGWSGYNYFVGKPADHMIHEKIGPTYLDKMPDVKITRRVKNPKDDSGLELVLFQFQTCPFCCKVRSFLDYSGLSYSVVEVDAVLRQGIKWSDTKKVPTMLVKTKTGNYVQLTDSSMIVSVLSSYLNDKSQDVGELAKFYPSITYINDAGRKTNDIMNKYFLMLQDAKRHSTNDPQEEERKWRSWADDHLVHLISPNVYRNKEEALETFEWFSDVGEWDVHFPKWERNLMVYVGALAMWAISKRLKKRHQLTDDVRSHIYDACDRWIAAVEQKKSPFLGGKSPNLADLAVFGILNSMEGCQAFKDCLENTNIGGWFYAVRKEVMSNRGQVV
ncbi:prostaglandin E synthase 2 [Topomyia yanbarensis]|uniref:prostaglandin E synthase 2 n=1 Tax=Topomyia yanbarensis TaxID=2498891 RepID=UPI00273CDBD4|nr:prostaglandin E synthase 2 [Topomyia yanbarensis]